MIRRSAATLSAALLALAMLALPAAAMEHGGELPEHGHIKLIGVDLEEETFHRCVDLANGRALRLNAHHDTVHVGNAGEALGGEKGNGKRTKVHAVIPNTPLTPWANCAEFAAFMAE